MAEPTPPTMIVPQGTEIQVDSHGQLSIRAPGNLVLQNSGSYGKIESMAGSIRIDRGVEVEAVSVECAAACFVQGSLTAWKVKASSLQLEESARANIVLQETERLEIGRDARLVGNFSNENDLFLLFSRFARQFRALPFYRGGSEDKEQDPPSLEAPAVDESPSEDDPVAAAPVSAAEPSAAEAESLAGKNERLPELLFFALVLLERDVARKSYGTNSQRVLEEIVKLLEGRDLETLRHTHRTLFDRVIEPGDDVLRASELIASHFQSS
ncbi:MAG: hypothetical protein AAF481_19475 [Acidobacteriota bacterium]